MSTTKQTIKARVISCKYDDLHKDGYRYELWFETPHGAWLGYGDSQENQIAYNVGEVVNCELIEMAVPPDHTGSKNDCTNWYRVL